MKIGIDVDGVLAELIEPLVNFHNERYGTFLTREDIMSHDLWRSWGGNREKDLEKVYEFFGSEYLQKIFPVHNSQNGVEFLNKKNDLVVITSRPTEFQEHTHNWIKKYYGNNFSGIYFTNQFSRKRNNSIRLKSDFCLELGVRVLIEDSLSYASECANKGVNVMIINCPWNQSEKLPERVTRVDSWEGALKELENFRDEL